MDVSLSELQETATEQPGTLRFTGPRRGGHDLATEQQFGYKNLDLHSCDLAQSTQPPCICNGDNYICTSQTGSLLSSMPNITYQVVKKILEFSFLNEKEIFSDLQIVPVSTIFKLLLVS